MATFDIKKLQNEITALNKEFADTFHKSAEASRMEVMKSLEPGEATPQTGRIYGEDNRKLFEEKAAEIRSKGYSLIEQAKADLQKQITEAPSQDAVNAVSMLSHRTSVTRPEVDNLLQVYGDNYQAYQAIRDIAAQHEIFVESSNLEKSIAAINGESRAVQSFTLANAESGNVASDGAIAFRDWLNNIN